MGTMLGTGTGTGTSTGAANDPWVGPESAAWALSQLSIDVEVLAAAGSVLWALCVAGCACVLDRKYVLRMHEGRGGEG